MVQSSGSAEGEEASKAWGYDPPCLCPLALLGFSPHLLLPTEVLPIHQAPCWGLPTLVLSLPLSLLFTFEVLTARCTCSKLLTLLLGFEHSQTGKRQGR